MRAPIYSFFLILLALTSSKAQIKIGDNPQNIHPSSLLELESTSSTLVITRVSEAQMTEMAPLPGAVVYNTDQECVFYYTGIQWQNLCANDNTTNLSLELQESELILTDSDGNSVSVELGSAIDQTFSANPIVNSIETIVITQTGDNYNFEVGEIRGDNIVDSTINGSDKIQNASITNNKMADDAIGTAELINSSVTNAKLDKANIPLSGFGAAANDVSMGSTTGSYRIINLADPTAAQDAATKKYVDAATNAINMLADGSIYVGDATNNATEVTISGDATMDNAGVLTIGANAIGSAGNQQQQYWKCGPRQDRHPPQRFRGSCR